ncbi:MAG: TadE/TadG family type IV pilus assembly protein [Pseudomonadota bacterium]
MTAKPFKFKNFRQFAKADEGVSAVEFALIAPLMLLMYAGCIELSLMMQLDRKVTTSTATLGDLTARATLITNDDLDDIFEATRMIFQPNDISAARMRVSSLREEDGDVLVDWSDACNLEAYNEDESITVPNNLVPPDGSVILAEIEYDYKSRVGGLFTNKQTLKDQFYLRPRRVDLVARQEGSPFTCDYNVEP